MVNYLEKYGSTVVKNGWPIVLLPHGSKKPIGFGWQQKEIILSDIRTALKSGKNYGFGIRCGNIVGIDDDYEPGEAVSDAFIDAVRELKDHYFPKSLWRRGRPTREPLRVIRLEDDIVAKSLNIDKLQIIGKGRQFVAYNLHPDTGKSYTWLEGKDKGIGSPLNIQTKDIPRYKRKDLENFLQGMLLLEETFGLAPDRAGEVLRQIKAGERPKRIGNLWADRKMVEKACEYIKNDPKWGWEDWNNNIMMPLYNASKGEEWGRELAHELSAQHDLYDDSATDERWDTIAKHPADLLGWPRLNWLARQNGMPFLGPLDWDNYRVFMDRPEILNTMTGKMINDKRFTDRFHKSKEKGCTVVQTFMDSRPEQVYDTITWDCTLPSGTAIRDNERIWNMWVPPSYFGEPGDVTPWLVVMDKVYGGKHMETVIKRMAYDVQYPHLRPQWHILITGGHGIGKSTSMLPLIEWASKHDLFSSITSTVIKGQFNSWLSKKKIILLNETQGISNAQFNDIKDMLAGVETRLPINEKFMHPRYEHIVASFYFSSNAVNPVSISKNERRLYVINSREPSPQEIIANKPEATAAYQWTLANWPKVIYYLKNDVKVSGGFAQTALTPTEDQKDMADLTAVSHERIADNIKELMRRYPVFQMQDIRDELILSDSANVDSIEVKNGTIKKALAHIGAFKLNKGRHVKVPINGHDEVKGKYFWSLHHDMKNADNTQIRFLYELFNKEE